MLMFSDDLQTASAAAHSRVKFRLAGGAQPLLLLPVSVNDRGPYEFILDTGAGTSLLAPELAAALQIQSTGSKKGHTAGGPVDVRLATVDSLGVGEMRIRNLEVAIANLDQLARAVGAKLDGDLGYNFLKHFRLTIDFRAAELRLEDPKRAEYFGPPPLTELRMRLAHPAKPLILVEAHVNGRGPFQFAIDTGTSTSAISPKLMRDLGLASRPVGQATTGGAPIAMTAARVQTLRVGAAQAGDLDVIIGDFLGMLSQVVGTQLDGIVGYNFLRNYKVTIDYPNESLSLFLP
jgi:predicted aspartyl protease